MTDVLPERETLTQPIAQRRYTPAIYDCNATAVIRPDETLILNVGGPAGRHFAVVDPDTSGDPVPLMRLLQEPPVGSPPSLPRPPAPKPGHYPRVEDVRKPLLGRRGKRRAPAPWWTHALWGGGLGMVLGALLVGIPVAALVTR